ncbi:hypothetical protein F4803DRAFT_270083 [Xylaria telfairii]|nr:hypothetical protein F4803DRAFT_270083 [Xylaria telfairii]
MTQILSINPNSGYLPTGQRVLIPTSSIVFLPMFGEQELRGWSVKGEGGDVIWPKHFLPADIPNARILAHGYHKDAGPGDYETDADHLCEKLKENRSGDTALRPIVIVAHSLGGILAAKVMMKGDESISNRVQGLAFFATPFQGSKDKGLPDILKSIMKTCGLDFPNDDFTKEIEVLEGLRKALSNRRTGVKLRSFSEESNGIVDYDAATMRGIPRHKVGVIKKDHISICKFESKEECYPSVIDELRMLAEVKPADTARTGMTNYGHIGNLATRDIIGGAHSENHGTVNYGPQTHHHSVLKK